MSDQGERVLNDEDMDDHQTKKGSQSGSTAPSGALYGRTTDEKAESSEGGGSEKDGSQVTTCPDCGGTVQSEGERGERTCGDCGRVLEEEGIDPGPEWRAYNDSEWSNRSRVGPAVDKLRHDDGLATNIGWGSGAISADGLSQGQRKRIKRMRTWNKRLKTPDAKTRTQKQGLLEIDRMASALGVPKDVRKVAAVLYRRAHEEGIITGRSLEEVASASLYAATRMEEIPRSLSEIDSVSRVERLRIGRAYRQLSEELGLEIPPADPRRYLGRIVSDLDGVTEETEQWAEHLLTKMIDEGQYSSRSPAALAAGAIWLASWFTNEVPNQPDLAEAGGVTPVTVRKAAEDLMEMADERWLYPEVDG